MAFETSNEMFINMKGVPIWDPKKSYFDQTPDALQFYSEEFKKIVEGVTIGGFKVHPWLYFHVNFFKTPIPDPKLDKDVLATPILDDNMLYITETYEEAKMRNLGMLLFGSRGFAKSTFLASLTHWTNLIKPGGTFSIVGGSAPDLTAITSLISKSTTNINPAFHIPTLIRDTDKYIEFGYKEKDGFRMTHSEVLITNTDKGTEKESEKGAGPSPIGFIADEIGKWAVKGVLSSAIPSFYTQHGAKLVAVLSGTAGNKVLSKDAKEILADPLAHKMLLMNWDRLDRMCPEEAITWEGHKKSTFATFVPAQMSYRLPVPKIQTNLGEYLGNKNPALKNIKIQKTDWVTASEYIEKEQASLKKEEDRNKHKMYFPTNPDHCFLTDSPNPFNAAGIDKHIRDLEEKGKIGKSIEIYRDGNKNKYEFSGKRRAEVSHPGGSIDAPIILHGDFPEFPPEKYTFISGLDDYKLDVSDTDSLGAFYILKRRNLSPDEPCETIAASFTSRPERHTDFHRTVETMIEAWDAECLMESVDVSFKQYLELKNKVEQMLSPSLTFSNTAQKRNPRLQSTYGLYPTAGNNEYRLNLTVDFTREEHTIGIDDDGNKIIKYGFEFIEDIDLLKEMRDYKKGGNFDRLTAFSHALVQCRELDKKDIRPKSQKTGFSLDKFVEKINPFKKMGAYTINPKLKRY